MQSYAVRPGDSPARIAIEYAGCPKCAIDLVRANPHKLTVRYPNGFVTFQSLRVGEHLNLPEKWFSKEFDQLPPSYFASLPHADGVTLGKGSVQGITPAMPTGLGDYPELDVATSKVAALAAMDNATFNSSVGDAGAAIDASVQEAYGSTTKPAAAQLAQTVQSGTQWAWQRNQDLTAALAPGAPINPTATTQTRLDITNALATALGNARLALNAYYGPSPSTPGAPPPATPTFIAPKVPVVTRPPGLYSASLQDAANAAVAAMAADPSYCSSVAQPGSSVNTAVHQFKTAWNATQSPKVPVGTGNYEAATAVALGQVTGSAPPACGARPSPAPVVRPPLPASPIASSGGGMSTAAIAGIGVLSAAAVGGAVYLTTRTRSKPTRRQRRR